jgi:hemolysin III
MSWTWAKKLHAGRLFDDEPLYCEGLHKPLLRGYLHVLVSAILPLGGFYLLTHADSTLEACVGVVFLLGNMFCYGISALLHRFEWSPEVENLILKLDHCGIFIMLAGNFTPAGVLCLPATGAIAVALQWLGVAVGCIRIFYHETSLWWEPIVVGCLGVVSIYEMGFMLTPAEYALAIASYVFSLMGGLTFGFRYPDPWREVFGFHEVFHSLVALASLCVYCVNLSVMRRTYEVL